MATYSAPETIDNTQVPERTEVRYSKNKTALLMTLGLLVAGFGAYFILGQYQYAPGSVTCLMGLVIFFLGLARYNNRTPQLILSSKGIQAINQPLRPWKEISGEQIVRRLRGKTVVHYLQYQHAGGTERIKLNMLDIKRNDLLSLIQVYRSRYKQKYSSGDNILY